MTDEIDYLKYSKQELDALALEGIKIIMENGSLPEWLLSLAQCMSVMEIRLKKLEESK